MVLSQCILQPEDPEWDEFGNDLYAIPEAPQVQSIQVMESIPSRVDEDGKIKAHIDMTDMDWQRYYLLLVEA